MEERELTAQIIDAALSVHSALGPGLLENAYEACLFHELKDRGLNVEQQVHLPLIYRGQTVDAGYRLDLVVEKRVIVEVKAVASVLAVHQAQLLSYLRLSNLKVGLLLNFHVVHMRDGIKRMAN
jgi:GxxExxY protein